MRVPRGRVGFDLNLGDTPPLRLGVMGRHRIYHQRQPPPDATWDAAIGLLSVTSRNVYEALRIPLACSHNVSKNKIPSYHSLTKHRPVIEGSIIQPSVDVNGTDEPVTIAEADFEERLLQIEAKLLEAQSLNPQADIIVDHTDIMCAKIKGTFKDYVRLMIDKFTKNRIEMNEDLICIDSYDGAEHVRSSTGRSNVISFSSQVISKDIIDAGSSAAGSSGILTWAQTLCEENFANLVPVVRSIFKEKARLIAKGGIDGKKIYYYELHDGKMIYLLTKHSPLNSTHSPFVLCGCKRGAGVKNPNHTCKLISPEDQKNTMRNQREEKLQWLRITPSIT